MTTKQLERAQELMRLIETTNKSINSLSELLGKAPTEKKRNTANPKCYDGLYSLCVVEYSDASGKKADLSRYEGNVELLTVIIETLKNQVARFTDEFKKL